MMELKLKIISDYKKTIDGFINQVLLTKGYVRTPNKRIMKLNVFNTCFDDVNIEDVINFINEFIPNLWDIPGDIQKEVICDGLMDLLPVASTLELNHYIEYVKLESNLINPKDLDKQVKKLLKDNGKKHKAVFNGGYNAPEYQAQALVNNDVFYCKSLGSYYIFVKNRQQFVKLTAADILKYVKEAYPNANLTKIDISDYMQTSYLFFVMNTDLPRVYNANQSGLMKLKEYKRDYNKVSIIISRCE